MNASQWNRLLVRLTDRTTAGEARWRRGAYPSSYVLQRPSGTIVVKTHIGAAALMNPVEVEVRGTDGEVIEELPSLGMGLSAAQSILFDEDNEPDAAELHQLHNRARRLAETIKTQRQSDNPVVDRLIEEI